MTTLKRSRGRPKGTTKWPREYYLLLLELRHRLRDGESLSALCRDICNNGGIQFVDDNGNVLVKITRSSALYVRIAEAKKMFRPVWTLTRPDCSDEAFRLSLWRGCPWMCVPARNVRRSKLAELFTTTKTKLYK